MDASELASSTTCRCSRARLSSGGGLSWTTSSGITCKRDINVQREGWGGGMSSRCATVEEHAPAGTGQLDNLPLQSRTPLEWGRAVLDHVQWDHLQERHKRSA